MNFDTFWADLIVVLVGGVILTFIFFLSREKFFPLPNIDGKWYLEVITVNTDYNPYKGMVLRYVIMFWSEGNIIKGSAEKIYENSTTGEREYIGKDRTRAIIEGYIEKRYFDKDKLHIHSIENGQKRESTNFYDLEIESNRFLVSRMIGTFNSMIANQDGTVIIQRKPF